MLTQSRLNKIVFSHNDALGAATGPDLNSTRLPTVKKETAPGQQFTGRINFKLGYGESILLAVSSDGIKGMPDLPNPAPQNSGEENIGYFRITRIKPLSESLRMLGFLKDSYQLTVEGRSGYPQFAISARRSDDASELLGLLPYYRNSGLDKLQRPKDLEHSKPQPLNNRDRLLFFPTEHEQIPNIYRISYDTQFNGYVVIERRSEHCQFMQRYPKATLKSPDTPKGWVATFLKKLPWA